METTEDIRSYYEGLTKDQLKARIVTLVNVNHNLIKDNTRLLEENQRFRIRLGIRN